MPALFGALGRGDFHQFYMGGTIARHRMWDDLYPIPHKNSLNNPGMPEDSDMHPGYFDIAKKVRVGNRLRFIQPPPVAVLLLPLAYIPFERAFGVWIAMSILCGWGVAWTACRILETLRGHRSKAGGLLMLLIAASPLMLHSIRVANMTLPVAFCIGLATLAIVQRNDALGGLATMLGGVTKYATLAVIPVAIAARRWRFIFYTLLFTALLFGGTYALCKSGPFKVYFRDISPTLTRTHGIPTNQSIFAFLTHVEQQIGNLGSNEPLQKVLQWALLAAEAITLAILLWLIFRKPVAAWDDPATVYAGIMTTLCVMLIFAPVFWEHYAMYLCPLWGWMLWEGWRSKAKLPLAILGIASMYVPWTYLLDLNEPANSHILFGTFALLAMGIWSLLETKKESPAAPPRGFSIELERTPRDDQRPVLPDVQQQAGAEVAR
jgi:cytochrome c oxidase subunit IV